MEGLMKSSVVDLKKASLTSFANQSQIPGRHYPVEEVREVPGEGSFDTAHNEGFDR